MSGIMLQLILIQPIMERVALSHQNSPRNGSQHRMFCKTLKAPKDRKRFQPWVP